MKRKIYAMIIASFMLINSAACNKPETSEESNSSTTIEETTEPTEPLNLIGDTVDKDNYTVTLNSIDTYSDKNTKENYILVNVTICNKDTEGDLNINARADIKLFLDNERQEAISTPNIPNDIINSHLFLDQETIETDRQVTGYVAYRYYKSFSDIEVEVPGIVFNATKKDISVEYEPTPIPTETTPVDTSDIDPSDVMETLSNEETEQTNDVPTGTTSIIYILDGIPATSYDDHIEWDEYDENGRLIIHGETYPTSSADYVPSETESPNGSPYIADLIEVYVDKDYQIVHSSTRYTEECNVPWYLYPSNFASYTELVDFAYPLCARCFPEYYAEHPDEEIPAGRPEPVPTPEPPPTRETEATEG